MSNNNNTINIILVVLSAIALIWFCSCHKNSREGYTDMTIPVTPSLADFQGKGSPLQFLSRPSVTGNMNPLVDTVSDASANSNYIRGQSPPNSALAATNRVFSSPLSSSSPSLGDQTQNPVQGGRYVAGVNDAASYAGVYQYDRTPIDKLSSVPTSPSSNEFDKISGELAYLGMNANTVAGSNEQRKNWQQKYNETLNAQKPNTLDYTSPKELLPVPDLRTPLMRDPSDPENFMYTRTLFAPLKTRNHNEGDRIRGDLNIQPVKTGWFDISTTPSIDLIKGYFGYYNDISEYTDVQDAIFQKDRDIQVNPQRAMQTEATLKSIANRVAENQLLAPNLAYGSASNTFDSLKFGSVASELESPFGYGRAIDQ